MTAPLAAIRAALETALAGLDSPAFPTAYENSDFTPVVGTPYQRVFLMPARPTDPTMGSPYHRETGIFRVTQCYPCDNTGTSACIIHASAVAALFHRGATVSNSGIDVNSFKTPHIDQGRVVEGWWLQNVDIFWYADIFA